MTRRLTIATFFVLSTSAIAGLPYSIDLNPPPQRTEFVTDKFHLVDLLRITSSQWNVSVGDNYFLTISGKDYSISFDAVTGRTTIKGNYHPDQAARDFLKALKLVCEGQRKHEQEAAIIDSEIKLIEQLRK
jgi:hypothetical protein